MTTVRLSAEADSPRFRDNILNRAIAYADIVNPEEKLFTDNEL